MNRIVAILLISLLFACTEEPRTGSSPVVVSATELSAASRAYEAGDYATALRVWAPLAEQGDTEAQHGMGLLHELGQGVPVNYGTAIRWYRLAAAKNSGASLHQLANLYRRGQGVQQNASEARRLYRLAAGQGIAASQFNLGLMYDKGDGGPRDFETAYMWLTVALDSGHPRARTERRIVASRLTPSEIAGAEKKARDCLASNYRNCD